jgi:hypothetical protein
MFIGHAFANLIETVRRQPRSVHRLQPGRRSRGNFTLNFGNFDVSEGKVYARNINLMLMAARSQHQFPL